jgi:hypothetical protein
MLTDPTWRYVKFFIYVPWPISIPEATAFMAFDEPELPCGVQRAEWLNYLVPDDFVSNIVSENRPFVVLQFRRRSIEQTRWLQYFHEAELLRERWAFEYQTRALPPENVKWWSDFSVDSIQTFGVIIEATTCLPEEQHENLNKAVDTAFERCIRLCEALGESYVQVLFDLRTGFINRGTVLPGVPALLIDPESRRVAEHNLRVNEEGAYPIDARDDLSPEQISEVRYRTLLAQAGDPNVTVEHWRRLAFRARHVDGDYAAAAVFAQTTSEVFFDAVLQSLIWEDNRSASESAVDEAEIARLFARDISFLTRLKGNNTFACRLKQGWYVKEPGNALKDLEVEVTWLRNQVVHTGYRPTEDEAARSFEVLDAAISFAVHAISRECNRANYPITLLMLAGRERLEQRGLYKGKVREKIEVLPPDWRKDFYEFRERIASLRPD